MNTRKRKVDDSAAERSQLSELNKLVEVNQIKDMMEERLSGLEERINGALAMTGHGMQPADRYYEAPIAAIPSANQLTPYEKEIRRDGFNKGLEVGMYVGAGIALLCLVKILR